MDAEPRFGRPRAAIEFHPYTPGDQHKPLNEKVAERGRSHRWEAEANAKTISPRVMRAANEAGVRSPALA